MGTIFLIAKMLVRVHSALFIRLTLKFYLQNLMIDPDILRANNIPFTFVVQRQGDFVFTAEGAYHFGFNTGPNIAEAVNFSFVSEE